MNFRISARTSLVVIATLFLAPLLLAWLMYSGVIEYTPSSTRNFGTLVEPPLPISWDDMELLASEGEQEPGSSPTFADHWVILYRLPESCRADCIREISELRQIHRAAGRHQPRIRIALLMPDPRSEELESSLRSTYSRFHLVSDPSGRLRIALLQAGAGMGSAYLIDPLGNIMMAYKAGADPNHLWQDLKRLLTWSKLDEQ